MITITTAIQNPTAKRRLDLRLAMWLSFAVLLSSGTLHAVHFSQFSVVLPHIPCNAMSDVTFCPTSLDVCAMQQAIIACKALQPAVKGACRESEPEALAAWSAGR
jgi:hypothetical protein